MNFHPIAKAVLSEINIGISSTKTYKKLVEYCTKNSTDYTEQNFLQQQIYIDDIHKPELFTVVQSCIKSTVTTFATTLDASSCKKTA